MAVGEKAIWGEVHWLAKEQNGFLLWSITNALQNTSPEVYWKSQVPLTPLLWKWQTLSWPTWLGTESHFQKVKGEVFIAAAQWNGAPGEWRSKRWLIYNAVTRVDADKFHDTWRGVTVGEIHCDFYLQTTKFCCAHGTSYINQKNYSKAKHHLKFVVG